MGDEMLFLYQQSSQSSYDRHFEDAGLGSSASESMWKPRAARTLWALLEQLVVRARDNHCGNKFSGFLAFGMADVG